MYQRVNQRECMADLQSGDREATRVHGGLTCMSMLPWTRKAPLADLQAWRVGGTWLGLPLCCQSTATRKLFVLGLVGVVMKMTLAEHCCVNLAAI